MAIAEAAAVVTTLKNASDLVQKLRSSQSKEELQAGIAALTEMLVNARIAALDILEQKALLMDERTSLNGRIETLERENRKLVDFDDQSQKYERVKMPTGIFVYREKQAAGGNSQPPYLCPHCFAEKKARILQASSDGTFFQCHDCRFGEYLNPQP